MPRIMNEPIRKSSLAKVKLWHYGLAVSMVLVLVFAIWSVFNATALRDWIILEIYTPPKIISQLAETDTMTSYAKELFYVNEPRLLSKVAFSKYCPLDSGESYVIGCYHSGDSGIYLLAVKQSQLNGIIPVTAAYEMLHAGYARLSTPIRNKIDHLMQQFYSTHNLGSQIEEQMASYAKSEPGDRYDEMYSVLATEVAVLPAVLNSQYRIYFTNRQKIVSMYEGYQAAFNTRLQALESDNAQLTVLKSEIDANESSMHQMLISINSLKQSLSSDQSDGDISAYNAGVPTYNSLLNSYQNLVSTIKNEINSYNQIVSSRNSLALEEQQLVSAISTKPMP